MKPEIDLSPFSGISYQDWVRAWQQLGETG